MKLGTTTVVSIILVVALCAHSSYAQDCNENGIADECDLECGRLFGGPCFVPGCGASLDCNANGVPDECDLAENDCNANGIPDDCDVAATGGAIVFATGLGGPEDIVASVGDYAAGFFVPDWVRNRVLHVSPLGGTVSVYASLNGSAVGGTFVPDEFGGQGYRLFVADRGDDPDPDVVLVRPDGSVELFAELPNTRNANGLAYVPLGVGGPAAGKLIATGYGPGPGHHGRIYLITEVGEPTEIVHVPDMLTWTPTLAPEDFGDHAQQIFVGDAMGNGVYVLDLDTFELTLFAEIPLGTAYVGVRQIAFSPVGWAASIDPNLGSERVLLVSVASDCCGLNPVDAGAIMVWDQRGRRVAVMTRGAEGLPFEPRGLLFVGPDVLISDLADEHGWLQRASINDFEIGDCNENGIPDDCDLDDGISADCNGNAIPDECESWNGDLDGDCDVDLVDFAILASCLNGPGVPTPPPGCPPSDFARADSDNDSDVDVSDFAALETRFTP